MPINKTYVVPHPPLIIPEVGRGQQNQISSTIEAFNEAAKRIAVLKPETIVIITPHSVMYSDYIHISPGSGAKGDFSNFGASKPSFCKEYDTQFVSELCYRAQLDNLPAGTLGERNPALDHAAMVPIYFIDKLYSGYKIVRIGISGLDYIRHYRLGQCIARAAKALKRNTVIIASGDLSHKLSADGPYGYAKEGPEFDKDVTDALKSADFLRLLTFEESFCEAAGECGLRSFIMMAGTLDGKAVKSDFLSYEGPFGVGYAVCEFTAQGDDESRRFADMYEANKKEEVRISRSKEDEYVRLARLTLETYVRSGEFIDVPSNLPEDLTNKKAGVFVSLKKNGRLRGCIGTIEPTKESIAEEIIANAVSAGTGDPRFYPVEKDELDELTYSVDVLGSPEDIKSKEELDPERYGVIISKGYKRGLLLPNLEGVDTAQKQISIALKKAGIPENSNYSMQRFEVVRHK